MKKLLLPLLLFLLLVSLSYAQSVELIPSATNVILYTGETESINLTIKNNQNSLDVFSISVFPNSITGVSANLGDYAVSIPGNSQVTTKLDFSSMIDAPELVTLFNVSVISNENSNIMDSKAIFLRTIKTIPVYISDLKLNDYSIDPDKTLLIETSITNIANSPSEKYTVQSTIKKDNEIVKEFDTDVSGIQGKSVKNATQEYKLEKYQQPGDYSVDVVLKDSLNKEISSKSTSFKVNAIVKLPKDYTEKSISIGFLSASFTIKVKNEGNIPSDSFYITESIPSFAKGIFDPEIEPSSMNETDGRVVYSWLIQSLKPGEETVIKYQFIIWYVWIAVVIVGLVVYAFFMVEFTPIIIKRYNIFGRLVKDKEISITLDVKNKTFDILRDVYVRDYVPSVAKLTEKFETIKPSLVRAAGKGTELIWKFDVLRQMDERIIRYKIKPVVEVTSLNLPNAVMRYTDKKKEKKTVYSRSLILGKK